MKLEDASENLLAQFGEALLTEGTDQRLQRALYDFIIQSRPISCLELGFFRGASSAFIAAALDENAEGHVITIDKKSMFPKIRPTIYDVLRVLDLENYVTPIVADTSYNWELLKMIEANTADNVCHPIFDFVFIDGSHTWETDGFAFFLVEKLLKRDGWIMFDDYSWSFEKSLRFRLRRVEQRVVSYDEYAKYGQFVESLPEDQRKTPQVGRVFDLLAKQHQRFGNFEIIHGSIALCQKIYD